MVAGVSGPGPPILLTEINHAGWGGARNKAAALHHVFVRAIMAVA